MILYKFALVFDTFFVLPFGSLLHMRDRAILLPSMSCYALTAGLWAAVALAIDRAFEPVVNQTTSTRKWKQSNPAGAESRIVACPDTWSRPGLLPHG